MCGNLQAVYPEILKQVYKGRTVEGVILHTEEMGRARRVGGPESGNKATCNLAVETLDCQHKERYAHETLLSPHLPEIRP